MMNRILLALAFFVALGLFLRSDTFNHEHPAPTRGHWGPQFVSDDNLLLQDFFAESDGHLVGWVENSGHASIRAHCEDVEDSDNGIFLGAFQSPEDAQFAVEMNCSEKVSK